VIRIFGYLLHIFPIVGLPHNFASCQNTFESSIHSTLSLKTLNYKSAGLHFPGICAADSQIFLSLWPTQIWYPLVMELLIQRPVLLPRKRKLLSIPQTDKIHPLQNQMLDQGILNASITTASGSAFHDANFDI
jgi:hypothetical protein